MCKVGFYICGILLIWVCVGGVVGETIPYAQTNIVPPTPAYCASVEGFAPTQPRVKAPKRRVLVFSLFTGFNHKVTPHVDRVFEILGETSGAFAATISKDIEHLSAENLAQYDVLVLNNNCSKGPRRNLLLDALESEKRYAKMTDVQRQAKGEALEKAMLDFVAGGKGLVVMHGALVLLNNSPEFTKMIGAAFDYHPPNQKVTLRTVEENHPMVAAFKGKGPFVHRDEPYCFKGAYEKLDFRPLLVMDVEGLKDSKGRVGDMVRYTAWIKPYGQGRVFYCSPSHFPESYENATLLQFILDGVQYAAGDLKCDDSTP